MSDGTILFKEWLPDLPELDNPGLTEAENVVPLDRVYKAFYPLSTGGDSLPAKPLGAIQVSPPSSTSKYIYAGTATKLYRQFTALGTWTDVSAATYSAPTNWEFAQYGDLVIATDYTDDPQRHTIGAATAFTTLAVTGTAPKAKRIGRIGQFIFLGDTNLGGSVDQHRVQWCAIDDPTNWPTPGSSTAVAVQSGAESLDPALGAIQAIVGGDQYGIIFQQRGLYRVTYVGGDIVFQFDKISDRFGLLYPRSVVPVGGVVYYISETGIMATNGSGVERIGEGKVDRYVENNFLADPDRVYGAYDQERGLIYWCSRSNPTAGTGEPDFVLIFNPAEGRFTHADQACEVLFQGNDAQVSNARGFSSDYKAGRFAGTSGSPGTAVLTTGEAEFNPGGFTLVQGVKPLVSGTSPAVTVALGYRNSQGTDATYTAEATATARTGFADFRNESRYHRARLTITGAFQKVWGLQFQAEGTGST